MAAFAKAYRKDAMRRSRGGLHSLLPTGDTRLESNPSRLHAGPVDAGGKGTRAVHARSPGAPARRVRHAGLASPVGRRRAAATTAGADVRRVALRDADKDAGEQAGTARVLSARGRTVTRRRAPAMTTHASAPGLVGCIADRAI